LNTGMYPAVSASMAALDRLDVITHNLANANTAGFKAQLAIQQGRNLRGADPNRITIAKSDVVTDFAQGPIEKTGNSLNAAIHGEGFFVIDTPNGQRLTRRGTFEIDTEGYLVTAGGNRVQGPSGDVNFGPLRDEAIEIAHDGRIQAGQESLGQLRIATVSDTDKLARDDGASFWAPPEAISDAKPGTFSVQQGAIERSNVSAIEGLMSLIETMRGFEAYTKATQQHDSVTQKAVTDVGRA
jgi:flagellar basal-body rod protein FlgF